MHPVSEPASGDQWTLVRNARQLLTLHGPSGPRWGPAMGELGIIPRGALLIRNGIIEEVGSSRRVENLIGARQAREIDATGRIVMPAFVDADVCLVMRCMPGNAVDGSPGLQLMSGKRVLADAAAAAIEYAGYGCLAVGAHTRGAVDFRNARKLLRVHKALRRQPLRIRSIFSPALDPDAIRNPAQMLEALHSKWLPALTSERLASVVELSATNPENSPDVSIIRRIAEVAAGMGYAIRLHSSRCLEAAHLELAASAGTIATVSPMDYLHHFAAALTEAGTVRVIPASEGFDATADVAARVIRGAIDQGAAIALTSSYRLVEPTSLNMQHLLHLAVHRLGLTPEEAITATTWNAACSLRMSHVSGSLECGKPADLLLMEVPDYRELARRAGHRDVSLVMREGQIIFRNPRAWPGARPESVPLSVD